LGGRIFQSSHGHNKERTFFSTSNAASTLEPINQKKAAALPAYGVMGAAFYLRVYWPWKIILP
jgi:hypothetical protein